jgi:two-component system response regulator FixJ
MASVERWKRSAGVLVIDDEEAMRDSLCALLLAAGYAALAYGSARELRGQGIPEGTGCLLVDVRLDDDIDGIDLIAELRREGVRLPIIVITGHADVPLAVRAMRAGATDFLEKPFSAERLVSAIASALAVGAKTNEAAAMLARLTTRERQVLDGLAQGQPNKAVARELGISVRTVEAYRATIMAKLNATSLADLVRLHMMADPTDGLPGAD